MTLGCQKMYAVLRGIPAWCKEDDGHIGPCSWPDVSGYDNPNIKKNIATWDGQYNFRFPPGMPPILEEKRT